MNGILLIVFGLLSGLGLSIPWLFAAKPSLITGCLMLLAAWGVWKRWHLAFYLMLFLAAFSAATGLFGVFHRDVTIGAILINLFIPLCTLIYFLADADVRCIFHT